MSKLAYFFISLHFLSVYFHFGSHSFGLIYFSSAHFAHDCCSHINASFDIFAAAIFIQLFIFLYYRTKTNHHYQHQISPAMFTKDAKSRREVRQTAVMGIDVQEWRYSWRAGTHTGLVQANNGSRWISSVWCLADKTMSISIMSSINVDIIKQRNNIKLTFALQILQETRH